MRNLVSVTSVLLLLALGCAPPGEAPPPEVDLEAERASLMQADRAWSAAHSASESPVDALVDQFVDNAHLLPPGAPMAQGREAIHAVFAGLEAIPGFSLTWGPTAAEVGTAGDLGVTIGAYEMSMDGPEGPIRIDGKYMTAWEKQSDGTWKVTADMFNANGPPSLIED